MSHWTELRTPIELELIVGFYDLTKYTAFSERTEALKLLEIMAGYHGVAAGIIENAGGCFIKAIGDAGLFVFQCERADDAITAVHKVLDEGDAWLGRNGYPGRARFGLHAGPMALGRIGAPSQERLDVIGKTVNIAAVLRSSRIATTPALFRLLSPEARKLFKKHTPPVSYIGADDPRPRDYWRGVESDDVVSPSSPARSRARIVPHP